MASYDINLILVIATGILMIVGLRISYNRTEKKWRGWVVDFFVDLTPELTASFFISLAVLVFVTRVERDQATARETAELLQFLHSSDNTIALIGVARLHANGWLSDGTLSGTDLSGANLQGAHMTSARLRRANLNSIHLQNSVLSDADLEASTLRWGDLRGADLFRANLQRVDLQSANLIGANLAEANLTRAILWNAQLDGANLTNADLEDAELDGSKLGGTDLSGANLIGADLQGADLVREDLGGANLSGADLTNAYLYGVTFAQILDGEAYHAVFDENTILPNGERWALGTDMTRFSDPNHPEFWKPLWVDSPGATWSQVQPDGDERPVRNLDN